MTQTGRLLGSGRDADIFEYGTGRVLRRSREGRTLDYEARVLGFLHEAGYPVPEVYDVSADKLELVMERVDGPTLVQAAASRPWTIRRAGRELAVLHRRLHELEAPAFVAAAPLGAGTRLLHRDLHPLNVLVGPRGPVVIDWAGACAGDPDVDVAIAWVLTAAGELPGGRLSGAVAGLGRRALLSSFLGAFDRGALDAVVGDVVAWKSKDPHMRPSEVARMQAIADGAAARRRR